MGSELTREDLRAFADDVKEYVGARIDGVEKLQDERFNGVTRRLDTLNGSVARHERELGIHGQKIRSVEKETFKPSTPAESTIKAFTLRDAKMIGIAFGAMGVVVEGLHQIGAIVYTMLTAAKHP